MFHVVLYEPEIPPNTGNIIRLCANTGSCLHLIEPLGFELDDKRLRRAGLDYHEFAQVQVHASYAEYIRAMQPARIFTCSTKARHNYAQVTYQAGDVLLFGPETRGLPDPIRQSVPPEQQLRIPMLPDCRSLNLSNAVAVMLYEAWRQHGFAGSA